MARLHTIRVGESRCHARSGQLVLDAAIAGGVDLPHDCRAGRCGACLVRAGITLGGQSRQPGMVHAWQAMVFSDLEIEAEPLPTVSQVGGRIAALTDLALDIVEVVIEPGKAMEIWPGQYCRFRFRGFPDRAFSPTAPLAGGPADGRIRLHVKRVRGGKVTPQLGSAIRAGHSVLVEGPFGHAYLRPSQEKRLVLIGSGTGFAPVWSVAAAALAENPHRRMVLVANSRKLASYYMGPALDLATAHPNVLAMAAVEDATPGELPAYGSASQDLPPLGEDDIVYAAGSPVLVDAVANLALEAGAEFHADPFEAAQPEAEGWMDRARAWLAAG